MNEKYTIPFIISFSFGMGRRGGSKEEELNSVISCIIESWMWSLDKNGHKISPWKLQTGKHNKGMSYYSQGVLEAREICSADALDGLASGVALWVALLEGPQPIIYQIELHSSSMIISYVTMLSQSRQKNYLPQQQQL